MRRLLFVAFTLGVAACNDTVTVCTPDLRFKSSPRDTTIAVGQQFIARLELFGCSGRDRLNDTITFQSSDLSVAPVGLSTSLVTGMGPGTATITMSAKRYPVTLPIVVTVR